MVAALRRLVYTPGEKTNTQAALALATSTVFTARHGDRPGAENNIIIITDAQSNVLKQNTLREASRAKAAGSRIVAVGVTDLIDVAELRAMSSPPHAIDRYACAANVSHTAS